MKRTIVAVAALLLLLALALSPGNPGALLAQTGSQATPTPAAEHEHMMTPEAEAEETEHAEGEDADHAEMDMAEEPTLADLQRRIDALEATVSELYTAHEMAHAASYDQASAVNVAIYLLDHVGLHEMETRVVADGEILPEDSGQVTQIARLLTTVEWPASLATEADALYGKLAAVATALGDDDLETAQPLMTDAHVAYHVFSHNAQMWLADAVSMEMAEAPGQANRVNTAIYLLDGVGLHDLSERLSTDEEILPGDSGTVAQAARLLTTVDWPGELTEDATALHETLSSLAVALADDDLEAATPLADQAHEAQHDFSHNAQMWLTHHGDGEENGEHSEDENHDEMPAEHTHGG